MIPEDFLKMLHFLKQLYIYIYICILGLLGDPVLNKMGTFNIFNIDPSFVYFDEFGSHNLEPPVVTQWFCIGPWFSWVGR